MRGPTRARLGLRRFIGVDLGGGRGKTTAVARLEHTYDGEERSDGKGEAPSGLRPDGGGSGPLPLKNQSWRLVLADAKVRYGQRGTGALADEPEGADALFRDEVLADYLLRWTDDATVVAIDAPLVLPPCLRCELPCPGTQACVVDDVVWMRRWAPLLRSRGKSDPGKPAVTPYTQRAVEVLFGGAGVDVREAMGQGTGPLAARAAHLRRRLSPHLRLHENLIEVSPSATAVALFGAARARKAHHGDQASVWNERKRILGALADDLEFDYVWPELVVRNGHVFAAVLCAFTGYLWSQGRVVEPDAIADPGIPVDAASGFADLWTRGGWVVVPRPA